MSRDEKNDHLIKDSFILFIATSVVNVSNFVFHMYATRKLRPDEYGVLATLLAVILIFTMPTSSLQLTIVNKTVALKAKKKFGSIEHLFVNSSVWFLALAAAAYGLLVLSAGVINSFFKIEDTKLILILGGIVVFSFLLPVARGVLQGLQKFISYGISWVLDALLRLTFLVVFIYLGWGVRGAMATTLCSAAAAYIVCLFMLGALFKYKDRQAQIIKKRELLGYALPVFAAYLGFSLLSYLDLFMVKHFFSVEQAGFYAVTSIIGKAFLFFPSAVIVVLFPKVAEQVELKRNPRQLLLKSVGLTAVISFVGIIVCFMFPELVLTLLTGGDRYFAIKNIVQLFGIAILPLVLFNVIINYNLASRKYNFIYFLYGGIALYALLLWFFHANFYTVLAVLFGVNLLMLGLSMLNLGPKIAAAASK
jgi:O-antigen/teichoic acid export membrane protein